MIRVKARSNMTLPLGREGENLAREIVFDISDWQAEYGQGTVSLIAQRPCDDAPYPCAITTDGSTVIWVITAADTAWHGNYGECELQYRVDDVLVKSETWCTSIFNAMGEPSDTPPEPQKAWVDRVLQAGADAQAAAAQAKADADKAAQIAAEMGELAAQVGQDAATASQAKVDAQTAQSKAETAQSAAETARQAAEDAANSSGANVEAATAAAARAEAAAGQAAAALQELQNLYQQMQEYVGQAIQAIRTEGDAQVERVATEGTAQVDAAKEQADRAENAAVHQPYPNAETGTWWVWDAEAEAYKDTGASYGTTIETADSNDALTALAECGVLTPAYQDGTFYTDASGAIYVL